MVGIDVSDSLVIVSVRGPASGVVHPDWTVRAVNGTKVRNKKQLAAALHAVAVGSNARFVLHKVNGVGAGSTSGNRSGRSRLILHRHIRRGYGLNLDDDLFVRSLRVDTDAYGKVEMGWRLQAVDGIPVTSKRQLVSALCSSSEASACVPNVLSAEFLFRHANGNTDPPQSIQPAKPPMVPLSDTIVASAAAEMAVPVTHELVVHRDPKHGFGIDVSDTLTVTSISRSPRKQVADPLSAQSGSRVVAVNGIGVKTKQELLNALSLSDTLHSAEFRFQQQGTTFEPDTEAAQAACTITSLAPTFEQEIGVPRVGKSSFISEAVSPDAVFDIAQIGPSPAPSPTPIRTSTATTATTMHLVDAAEPTGMTMPAIGTRASVSSCLTASGPLMFDNYGNGLGVRKLTCTSFI